MSTVSSPTPVSDMLVTVKSREVQRGMLAEMRTDAAAAARHFLAAAHLELVLADDYAQAGRDDLAFRSRLGAVSCLWRAGRAGQARTMAEELARDYPGEAGTIQSAVAELEGNGPGLTTGTGCGSIE